MLADPLASLIIEPLSAQVVASATERQARLTKPPGSMGVLEQLGIRLAGMYGVCPPPLPAPVAIAVFAADHGVHAQGVSPWSQEVTAQMVGNILAGGAVISAVARQLEARLEVVDVGVAADLPQHRLLRGAKVAPGTADMTGGPAMSEAQVAAAIRAGLEVADDLVGAGYRLLVGGDMGIANTTASAALVSVLTGRPAVEVTGRGTGVDDRVLDRKVQVVQRALAVNGLEAGVPATKGRRTGEAPAAGDSDPLSVLAAVGGLEHAAMVGFLLGAAARRTPVVLDGVISVAAALVAHRIRPEGADYWVAGHRSAEPGAAVALAHLGQDPLLDLGMRLGEGSGAALAVPLVQAAARILREVASFDDAGISRAGPDEH